VRANWTNLIDSLDVQLLMDLAPAARRGRRRLVLVPARDRVQRIFTLTRTAGALPFAD
jgi:anti-anti-sigma regulatory factor